MKFHIISLRSNNLYFSVVIIFFLLLFFYYIDLSISGFENFGLSPNFLMFCYFIIAIGYIIIYKKSYYFNFDSFFFIIFFFIIFYKELVLNTISDITNIRSIYYSHFPESIENKSKIIQLLGFLAYIIGGSLIKPNYTLKKKWNIKSLIINKRNVKILALVILIYIIILLLNGQITKWFHYGKDIYDYSNTDIVYITIIFVTLTSIEFSRLSTHQIVTFKNFILHVNKLYFIELIIISSLLLISGNRNEALLIIMPFIISYSIFIRKISNIKLLCGVIAGIIIFTFIGYTRDGSIFSFSNINSNYSKTRDYAPSYLSTIYLIQQTDKTEPIYFENSIIRLFSSVPFLGGITTSIFEIKETNRSAQITSENLINDSNSSFGTSLIGDLYYTAKTPLVLIYMFFLGIIISSLFDRYVYQKKYNIWLLLLYIILFSNVIYFLRAEWTMPFRYIGFSYTIILILSLINTLVKSYEK